MSYEIFIPRETHRIIGADHLAPKRLGKDWRLGEPVRIAPDSGGAGERYAHPEITGRVLRAKRGAHSLRFVAKPRALSQWDTWRDPVITRVTYRSTHRRFAWDTLKVLRWSPDGKLMRLWLSEPLGFHMCETRCRLMVAPPFDPYDQPPSGYELAGARGVIVGDRGDGSLMILMDQPLPPAWAGHNIGSHGVLTRTIPLFPHRLIREREWLAARSFTEKFLGNADAVEFMARVNGYTLRLTATVDKVCPDALGVLAVRSYWSHMLHYWQVRPVVSNPVVSFEAT